MSLIAGITTHVLSQDWNRSGQQQQQQQQQHLQQ
jgi:hypothetical protein